MTLRVDVLIIGGGIAGLWLLEELSQHGFSTLLAEQDMLGGRQTMAAQGILHGGVKYALGGYWSKKARLSSGVLDIWRQCLAGTGPVDLRSCNVLMDRMHLAFPAQAHFARHLVGWALRSRVRRLAPSHWPQSLRTGAFSGSVSILDEPVLDVTSLMRLLARRHSARIARAHVDSLRFVSDNGGERLCALQIEESWGSLEIAARSFLFAAGGGNSALLERLGVPPNTKERPLHQVLVKHNYPYEMFMHFVKGSRPNLTISSHKTADGARVWYLGGELAERGVQRSQGEQIEAAQRELSTLLPALSLPDAEWKTLRIQRAEPVARGRLPTGPTLFRPPQWRNLLALWPGKLTWAPLLTTPVLDFLGPPKLPDAPAWPTARAYPTESKPPWDLLF